MDLSIIYVNWNSTEYLCASIASVYAHTKDIEFEIIVVDNASPDGDVDRVATMFPQVRVIKSEQNLGFAGANNVGFRQSCGRHLLFLNPDTVLVNEAIKLMLRELESRTDAGLIGCKLLNTDLSVQTSCVRAFPTLLNTVLDIDCLKNRFPRSSIWGMAPLYAETNDAVAVEVLSGACMMVDRTVFEEVGLFNEEYFMYAEDVDLCYSMVQHKRTNYYCGEGLIVHHGGKSSPSEWAIPMMWKADLRLYRKMRGALGAFALRIAMIGCALARLAVLSVLPWVASASESGRAGTATRAKWRAILRVMVTQNGKHPAAG